MQSTVKLQTSKYGLRLRGIAILCIGVIGSAMNPQVISLNLGFIQLSVFRIMLIILLIMSLLKNSNRYQGALYYHESSVDQRQHIKLKTSYGQRIMLIWLAYAILSVIWAKDFSLWIKNVFYLCVGNACFWVVPNFVRSPKQICSCLRCFSLMGIVHNIIGWYEVVTGNYFFLTETAHTWVYTYTKAPASLFGGENPLATYLVFSILFTAICLANSKKSFAKCLYCLLIISSVLLLMRTSSRGNLLGLILALLVFLFYKLFINRKHSILVLLLLIFLVVAVYIGSFSPLLSDFFDRFELNFLRSSSSSNIIRMNLIKNGFQYFFDSYLMGVGAGNSSFYLRANPIYFTGNVFVIHNYWMEILVDYGIIIIVLMVAIFIKSLKNIRRIYALSSTKIEKSISLGFICCLVAFLPCSISGSSYLGFDWLWLFWGLVMALQKMGISSSHKQEGE